MRPNLLSTLALGVLCLGYGMWASGLRAQSIAPAAAPAPPQAAPLVGELRVTFQGVRNVSDQVVLANIQLREGEPYSQTLADRSIRSLYATRLFDFIDVRTETMAGGRLRVTFTVSAKYRMREVRFEGNRKVRDRTLLNEIREFGFFENLRPKRDDLPEGVPPPSIAAQAEALRGLGVLDERSLSSARQKLLTYYREKGWTNVQIEYDVRRDPVVGVADVIFTVNEGPRYRISSLDFQGNSSVPDRRLRREMKTRRWSWAWSWLTATGRFKDQEFTEDLDKVRDYYRNEGYLDVDINEANVGLQFDGKRNLDIVIPVDEGRQYRLGNVTFEGNALFTEKGDIRFSPDFLQLYQRLKPGDVFSPKVLDEDIETMQDYYGNFGYLEARIRADRRPNLETGAIDVVYRIEEGDQYFVESINIEGNTTTKSEVVIRELALAPGDIFNRIRMKTSESRLKNTRFFEENSVNLTPEATNIPQRRNLKIQVEEGRTGNFTFGAGFSSLESAVIFFELTQGNFDLFNYRSFFQGDGQKFRLRVSLGSRSSEFNLSFEEPWLFEQQLTFGFEIFRTTNDYDSDFYTETRSGFETYLRRRLYELWEGRLTYRLENVGIDINSADASGQISDFSGSTIISKLSGVLVRDTRNSLLYPTRGNRVMIMTEHAGLGGDIEYQRFESQLSQFIPTFELGEQSIGILGRLGTIWPYSDEEIPFFDRYFLGGPRTMRGFEYRDVGPKDPDNFNEPAGGNSYGFLSIEYTVKLADPLRFAVFYDWGFVNSDEFDYSPIDYNDNWGFGVRILVLGAPMSLDYGLPITTDDFNDQGGQFYFSFGTRF